MSLSRRTIWLALLVFAGVIALCPGCRKDSGTDRDHAAFEVDKVYERGPVTVHVRLDKTSITIVQTLLLQLEAAVQPEYEMQMPKVDEALKDFGLVDWSNLGRRLDANDNVVTTYEYRLEPFLSGQYEIPAFTFVFHDANEPDATHELSSEPIPVEVTSLLGEDRAKLVINDIEGVVDVPKKASWRLVWVVAGVCLASVPLGWWLLRKKWVRAARRVFQPAHEVAYARLRALVAEDLVAAGRLKGFYERLSGILRHYIEDRFDLHAPERTTEEFLVELGRTALLAEPDKAVLGEFLTHCDLVKFARHAPTNEQIQRSFDLVKDFIERTKSQVSYVDVTEQVQAEQRVEVEVA
ncbi:MAG: hypothetical protein JW993_14840 [Sedimentisphaerales bacterium]|nr:hypothetical protein [Sedimentisphaerales bacterium]